MKHNLYRPNASFKLLVQADATWRGHGRSRHGKSTFASKEPLHCCSRLHPLIALSLAFVLAWTNASLADAPPVVHAEEKENEFAGPRTKPPVIPKEFAFTFSLPYGIGDEFPLDEKEFERMLVLLKGAGFNTVHCVYKDWRHKLFKKHKMKMMVDVLAWKAPSETDIRRNDTQRALIKANCIKSRGSEGIWGYNLWNERLDWFGDFNKLDLYIRILRTWDPTHPVWVGTYNYYHAERFKSSPGVNAWYDYHWTRGMHWHFKMLHYYRGVTKKRNGTMGKWMLVSDYNRNLYTLNMGIAHGVKTVIWFIGGPYASREPDTTKRWNEDYHLNRVGRHMRSLYRLIGEMGPAVTVHSTPTSRTPANRDKPFGVPADTTSFPKDHWLQIKQGEVLCGFFRLPDSSDLVWVANHNAYAWQGVVMSIKQDKNQPLDISKFDRATGKWVSLGPLTDVNFALSPADARVFRVRKAEAGDVVAQPEFSNLERPGNWKPGSHFTRVANLLKKQGGLAENQNQPLAIFSTPTKRTPDNRDKTPSLPQNTKALPEDFWLQVKQGEVLCGFFKLKDGSNVLCLANHNALAWQGVLVTPRQVKGKPIMIWELDQKNGKWSPLGTWGDVNLPIPPAGSAVLKFKETTAQKPNPSSPEK